MGIGDYQGRADIGAYVKQCAKRPPGVIAPPHRAHPLGGHAVINQVRTPDLGFSKAIAGEIPADGIEMLNLAGLPQQDGVVEAGSELP
ncbi:hypothetical protein GCM10027031_17320 [Corynebacterium atrinae]